MQVISTVVCDFTQKSPPKVVYAMQGDANTRYIEIDMRYNGAPWTPPEGAYAYVAIGKSNNKKAYYRFMADGTTPAVAFDGSKAKMVLLPEALDSAGIATATIYIFTADDVKLSPLSFTLNVQRAPVTDDDIISSDYYQLPMQNVLKATEDANAATDEAIAATNDAKSAAQAANTAADNANAAAESVKSSTAEGMNVIDGAAEAALADINADTATGLTQIQQASAAAQEDVVAQGELVKASIPADYTALSASVDKIEDDYAPAIVESAEGEVVVVQDSAERGLKGLRVFGRTEQDGTPTPEAPVPLVSVGDDGAVEVTAAGKNLATPFTTQTKNGITLTANADGSFTLDGTATMGTTFQTAAFSLPIGTYTISLDHAPNVSGDNLYISVGNQSALMLSFRPGVNVDPVKTGTNSQETPRLVIYVNKGATINNYTAKLQLEAGSVATAYEPYKGQTLTLTTPNGLPGIPVDSGGNYTDADGQQWVCDEVDLERGVYVQRVKRVVLDRGITGYKMNTGSAVYSLFQYSNVLGSQINPAGMISTHFHGYDFDELWNAKHAGIGVSSGGSLRINIENSIASTIEEFNAWLAENPVTAQAALATPIETPLTASEIAAYKAMLSRKPTTTIYNDAGAHMAVDYMADTKTWINNKIAALSSAIINNA